MDPYEKQGPSNTYNRRFGFVREPRRASAVLTASEDTTAWEIYNHHASTIDRELIKDWNDSLNTLLIFAALYSAVLTAFIIESMKLLQENTGDISRDVLLVISRQLANRSVEAYNAETFFAPAFAVRVNSYFFLSISFSLVAALGAVLALQWVGSYDAGLNQSSPVERALQRHFRNQGIQRWKMVRIIAFLPALIFIALFLFFIGLAEWLWNINKGVAGIVIAGLICGATFFFVTTVISMVHVSAPFRTPASRSLPRILARLYCSLVALLPHSSSNSQSMKPLNQKNTPPLAARPTLREQVSHTLKLFSTLLSSIRTYAALIWVQIKSLVRQLQPVGQYLRSPHLIASFDSRETAHVHSIIDLKRTALLSLASSLDILPHTANAFRAIIHEVLLLPPTQLVDSAIQQAPWGAIFDLLLEPYLRQTREEEFSDQEVADIEQTLQAFSLVCSIPALQSHFAIFFDVARGSEAISIRKAASLIEMNQPRAYSYLFDDLRTVLACMDSLPTQLLLVHLLHLQNRQREEPNRDDVVINFSGRERKQKNLAQVIQFDLATLEGAIMPESLRDTLLDILAVRYTMTMPPRQTAIERYSYAIETFLREEPDAGNKSVAMEIHEAIISQILGNALRVIRRSKHALLDLTMLQLRHLLHAIPSVSHGAATTRAIFQVLSTSENIVWSRELRLQTQQLYSCLLPTSYSPGGDNWADWRTRFYVGLQMLLQEREWFSASSRKIIRDQASMEVLGNDHETTFSPLQIQRLSVVQDPILLLYVSSASDHLWEYPPSDRIRIEPRDSEEFKSATEHWCDAKMWKVDVNAAELAFLRNVIVRGNVTSRLITRLARIRTINGRKMMSDDWYSLLCQPALGRIVEPDNRLDLTYKIHIVDQICGFQWFFKEFTAAHGFSWLIEKVENWLVRRMVSIICRSLELTSEQGEVDQWITCLHQTLSSVKNPGYDRRETLRRPELFIKLINRKYPLQDQIKEDIISGLRAGFIAVPPIARFGRDPDGVLCYHG